MLRPTRRLISAAILLFWLVMMGVLIRHEFFPRLAPASPAAPSLTPTDHWMGVYMGGGERVGFINMRSAPETKGGEAGTRLRVTANLSMSLFGQVTRAVLSGTAWQSNAAGLREFQVSFTSGEHSMQLEGGVRDGQLDAEIQAAGESFPISFPVDEALMLPDGEGLTSLSFPVLEPGEEVMIDAFDPTTMSLGRARIRAIGRETLDTPEGPVETTLVTIDLGAMKSRAWVTAQQEVLRAETPFGLTLARITPEEALEPVAPTEKASLVRALAVIPTGEVPRRGAHSMRVRLLGLGPDIQIPDEPLQRSSGESEYSIQQANPGVGAEAPLAPEERTEALVSDAFITADHPKIREAAAEIVRGESDPWKQALALNAWLFEELDKVAVMSVPNALDVLRTKEGDCNEHSVLYVALARALGIPARIAIGLVWSEELEGFGYHAWPEVFVKQWIPLDPTLGQEVADATHIKLLNGGIERWTRLVPFIGKLQLDVLAVS